jgi:hypothetical protein
MNRIDRRGFLLRTAGVFGMGLSAPLLRAVTNKENELSVDFSASGKPIPADFLGFSYDTVGLTMDRLLLPQNISYISLIRRLGSTGVIRIGGNSSDRPSIRKGVNVSPGHIEHLAAFLSKTGWRLIYGLNLGTGKPEQAASEAALVANAVGSKLMAFQIGNEPDGFRNELRSQNYNHPDFIAEWRVFAKAIRARVPGAPLAGPDVGFDTSWLAPFASAVGPEVAFLTYHFYSEGQMSGPEVGIENMLGSGEKLAGIIDYASNVTAESGLRVRMAEINSVTGGGQSGVSDTLAAALWGVDVMFTLATAGWLGVNFHGGGGIYNPIVQTASGSSVPKPIYYAMLFFAEAGRGSIVPIRLQASRPTLRVYAVRGTGGERRIIFVNINLSQGERVLIGTEGRDANLLRLTAPSVHSQSGLTFGGSSIGPAGNWVPRAVDRVPRQGNRFIVDLPPASAAIVHIIPK